MRALAAALYVESAVFGNPLGRWYKDGVRPLTGALLGTAGRLAWHVVNWWHNGQVRCGLLACAYACIVRGGVPAATQRKLDAYPDCLSIQKQAQIFVLGSPSASSRR